MRRRFSPSHVSPPLTLCAALAAGVVATVVAPGGGRAAELWTDPPARRTPIAIPSVAPLITRVEPAVLVVFTEGGPADEEGLMGPLPPGHPALPGAPGGGPPLGEGPDSEDGPFDPDDMPPMEGQGAGFIITASGYAVTNHHVIEGATAITVRVGESHEEVPAKLIGTDEKTDIALLHIESSRTDWPVVPLGDSDGLQVGDFVIAIGSPFGLEQSVSVGIVSGRGRKDIEPSGRAGLYDFLQTDASINPGNSGGPLLNLSGEVIGINAAVNAAGNGIGFAIPINMVKRVLPELKKNGRFLRSWLGVSIQAVAPDLAKDFGLDRARGALIREVVGDGPAAKAGVLPGDIITRFDGRPIEDSYTLPLIAGDAGVGKTVKLELMRDAAPMTVPITLGPHPDNAEKPAPVVEEPREKDATIGVSVVTLDGDARTRLRVARDLVGARVTKIRPGSPAFEAGLAVDDVIVKVGSTAITSASTFAAAVKATPKGLLKLLVRRGTSVIFVALAKP